MQGMKRIGPGEDTQTSSATPRKVFRILEKQDRVNEKRAVKKLVPEPEGPAEWFESKPGSYLQFDLRLNVRDV
jgi:hypothetical protein